jgi:catechol 2,3-dioxygenase-like lactoylglutathione lyase family enzyme
MPEGKIKLTVSGKSYRLKPGSPGFAGSNEEYGIKNTCGFTRMGMAILAVLVALFCAPQLRAQTPPLVGIAHVAFRVADLGKSQDFYRALGFQQAFEFTDAGKTSVVFIKINDHQFIELYPRTEESESLGLAHVCFETTVLEPVRSEYLKQGLKPSEIEKGRAGNMLFDLLDFEGQLLEYIQYLPGSLHSLDRGKHLGSHRISQHLLEVGIPVRNIVAERTFYTTKLAFEHSGPGEAKLRLPGNSGNEIELESASTARSPQITFAVENTKRTAKDLRHRGFKLYINGDNSVLVSDPGGLLIAFTASQERKR